MQRQTMSAVSVAAAVLLLLLATASNSVQARMSTEDVVVAVNAGGSALQGFNGVRYEPDQSVGRVTPYDKTQAATSYLPFINAAPQDRPLFQTERWGSATFKYSIGKLADGSYTLLLRFAEVYFRNSGEKTFDVRINGITVLSQLDIYDRVGHGEPLDEFIPFTVTGGQVIINKESGSGSVVEIEFVKNGYDNPKICAIVIARAPLNDMVEFFKYEKPVEPEEQPAESVNEKEMDEIELERSKRRGKGRKENPYAKSDDSSWIYIVGGLVAVAAVLFMLMGGSSSKPKKN